MSRKEPTLAAVAPVSDIAVDPQADRTDLHSFTVDGVLVQVRAVRNDRLATAETLIAQLHAVCSIPPAPPRIEAWGPGQFDRVRLGPGVEAWIRITPAGRVLMVVPGGELDVTDGGTSLGTGLHEAGARAAQIRVQLTARATGKAERLGHAPVWTGADCACSRCEASGGIDGGKPRGSVFAARCKP